MLKQPKSQVDYSRGHAGSHCGRSFEGDKNYCRHYRARSASEGSCGVGGRPYSGDRFKVFKHLNDWWEEFRLYHRKDGLVVKEGDDLMAATRYALMMLRFASTEKIYRDFRRPLSYPKLAIY